MRLVFFLSGFASLAFEAVWFRLAGHTLGNSVRASSIVLAAFMAGLALGNLLSARVGHRVASPLRAYALLELVIGMSGILLVLVLPGLGPVLAPLFANVFDDRVVLDAFRALVAFLVMVVPTTAMGATLPLVARAQAADGRRDFGSVLGGLYGWNTLGGMAGAVVCEAWIVGRVGLFGAALVAGALNAAAAAGAFVLARRWVNPGVVPEPARRPPPAAALLLFAAFVAGGALLGLEVVWFRFLQLFVFGTSLAFAVMLGVVLLGIGAGSLAAGAWLANRPGDVARLPALALACGAAVVGTYALFDPQTGVPDGADRFTATITQSLKLMLLPSIASGAFFTACGKLLRGLLAGDAESAGNLTLANTTGAMAGAVLAGFVWIPLLGVEGSIGLLAASYAVVALAVAGALGRGRAPLPWAGGAALVLLAVLAPAGHMTGRFLPFTLRGFVGPGSQLIAFREGVSETVSYVRTYWGGQPLADRLITNGHSMTASDFYARRYMALYAQWALAVRPDARKALLISYGIGNTAKALTDWPGFEAIHVVDISSDVLELGAIVFPRPEEAPLRDPRVRVHVEDGRFFLLTTKERFDLITAEPPPPAGAGIVNLYTLEYFQLLRERLEPGGVVTYWLPVNQLDTGSAQAITSAFCAAFPDCSLWNAAGLDWMLAGTRDLRGPVAEADFVRPWAAGRVREGLLETGLDVPELLGTLFLADAAQLAAWTRGIEPVDDDHPQRITGHGAGDADRAAYRAFASVPETRQRFEASAAMAALWPPGVRARTLPYFALHQIFEDDFHRPGEVGLGRLEHVLRSSPLRVLPLLLLDSEPRLRDIARGARAAGIAHPAVSWHVGAGALADRDFAEAARSFSVAEGGTVTGPAATYAAFAWLMAGDMAQAREAFDRARDVTPPPARAWLESRLADTP